MKNETKAMTPSMMKKLTIFFIIITIVLTLLGMWEHSETMLSDRVCTAMMQGGMISVFYYGWLLCTQNK